MLITLLTARVSKIRRRLPFLAAAWLVSVVGAATAQEMRGATATDVATEVTTEVDKAKDDNTPDAALDTPKDAEPADGIHPTLDAIFQPPRLLGVQPRLHGISADGRFVTWLWTDKDEDTPKPHLYVSPAKGGEPRKLFANDDDASLYWTRDAAVALVVQDGWLMQMDVAEGGKPRPLMEVGRISGLTFLKERPVVMFQAGADNRIWSIDLKTGERRAPADDLKNRGRWFQVLESTRRVCVFAAPVVAETEETKKEAAAADKKADPQEVPRVLHLMPLDPDELGWETTMKEGGDVSVSADGKYAFRDRAKRESSRKLILADYLTEQVTTVGVRSSLPGDAGFEHELSLYDIVMQMDIPLPLDHGTAYWGMNASWSNEGSELLLERLANDFHVRQILIADPQARSSRLVFSERDDAWIGPPELYAGWTENGDVLFTSEQSGFNHLYLAPADGDEPRAITDKAASYEVHGVYPLDGNGDALIIKTNEEDPAEQHLYHVDLRTGAKRKLTEGHGFVGAARISQDGRIAAYAQAFLGVPEEIHAVPIDADSASPPVRLSDTISKELQALDLPAPEIVTFENKDDGVKVRAFLYRPEPFDPTKQYPAVMFIHGAGSLQNITRSMSSYGVNMLFHHRLARKGYFVLDPDYRHSLGYGRDFRTAIHGFMGGKDLDDAVFGVEYLKSLGNVDTAKVGIYGGSYGGFMTLMALFTKPDVFAAGCALRSVTDWRTYNAWYTNARLGDPKEDAENYEKSSPIDHADGLKHPLLILHGLKDSNVFAQDSIRLIEKLIELGKDFDAMLYPSQDHGFTDPDSWLDEYKRIERYFDRHLKAPAERSVTEKSATEKSATEKTP